MLLFTLLASFPIGITFNPFAENGRIIQIIQPTNPSNVFESNQLARSDVGSEFNQPTGQNVQSSSALYAQPPNLDIENQPDMLKEGIPLNQFNVRFTHGIKIVKEIQKS